MVESQEKAEHRATIDEMLPSDLLGADEEVLFALKPSPWYIVLVSVRWLVAGAVVLGLALTVGRRLGLGRVNEWMVMGAVAGMLARLGFGVLQWVSRSYVLTDRRVIRIRGVFAIDIFQSSLGRIQNTFLRFSLAQRLLGLGSIAFTTAGTGEVEAVWRDLSRPLQTHHELLVALNGAEGGRNP